MNLHVPTIQLQHLSTLVNSLFHTNRYSVLSSNQISEIAEISVDRRRDYTFCFIHRILPHRDDDLPKIIYLVLVTCWSVGIPRVRSELSYIQCDNEGGDAKYTNSSILHETLRRVTILYFSCVCACVW